MIRKYYYAQILAGLFLTCCLQAVFLVATSDKLALRDVLKSVSGNKILSFEPFMMRGKVVSPENFDLFCSEGPCKVPFSKDLGFNLNRKKILLLTRNKVPMSDLVAIDSAHGEVLFKDFRMWTNRGVYWDFKVNGAAYYASPQIIELMTQRRKINDVVFSCNLTASGLLEAEPQRLNKGFAKRKKHIDDSLIKEPVLRYERCHSNREFEDALVEMYETGVRWILYDGQFPRVHPWLQVESCIGSFCLLTVSVNNDDDE